MMRRLLKAAVVGGGTADVQTQIFNVGTLDNVEIANVGGFGSVRSVTVNGIRFDTSEVTVTADGTQWSATIHIDMEGAVVKLRGLRNDDGLSGIADRIEVENEVRGVVTAVAPNTFTVLGQTVIVSPGTVISPQGYTIGRTTIDDTVEVHGFRDGAGTLFATRVDVLAFGQHELRGVIATKDAAQGTFTVWGSSTAFTFDNAFVTTTIVGGTTFDIGDLVEGRPIRIAADTQFVGGLPADLANDVIVKAEGYMQGGHLVADRIEFDDSLQI